MIKSSKRYEARCASHWPVSIKASHRGIFYRKGGHKERSVFPGHVKIDIDPRMTMAQLGYARVSTSHQTNDQQLDALNAAGVDRIYSDVMSGVRADRPGLAELLAYARDGDTVVIVALDRLGRSLTHIVRTLDDLRERGILVRSLREGIDTSTSTGRMVAGIFASLAEYERSLLLERAAAARAAAIARGQRAGRRPKLTDEQVAVARRMRERGEDIHALLAAFPQASRATLYRLTRDLSESELR